MAFSSKKIGEKLGTLAAEHPHLVVDSARDIAKFIVSSGKTSKINDIIRHFKSAYNRKTDTVDLTITAAHEDHIPKITEIAGKKADVKVVVDPTLIGGIKIETEDYEIDSSIQGKLRKLKTVAK